jgi:hypothetical protein
MYRKTLHMSGGLQRFFHGFLTKTSGEKICGTLDDPPAPTFAQEVVSEPSSILVHQMGKVGSTAIAQSLDRVGVPCLQTHAVGRQALCRSIKFFLNQHTDLNRIYQEQHLFRDQLIATKLLERSRAANANKLRIITLSREPVDRWFSALLQNYPFHVLSARQFLRSETGKEEEDELECFSYACGRLLAFAQGKVMPLAPQKLFQKYWRSRMVRNPEADFHLKQIGSELILPLTWFITQFERPIGVNLFGVDVSSGIVVTEQAGARVLLLKHEVLRDNPTMAQKAISEFVDTAVVLSRSNVSSEKARFDVIQALRARFEAEFRTSRLVQSSLYCQHFGY